MPIMLAGYGPAATSPATMPNPAAETASARRPDIQRNRPSAYRNPIWWTASQTNSTFT
jgi:hypothetical protein